MTTYDSIAATFTDNDDQAVRLAMLDALAEAEAAALAFANAVVDSWYGPEVPAKPRDYRLDPDYDPDMETEAERVGVDRY